SRVLRRAAITAGSSATDLSAAHVAELDRLVTDWRGQGPLHLPGGVRATRDCGTLSMAVDT
ncbi:MAG: TilS substrate-binding domain-containing protein, partial [Actinomycetes bacterium]